MAEYMLLLHEDPSGFADIAPAEIEAVIAEYVGWRESLAAKGRRSLTYPSAS